MLRYVKLISSDGHEFIVSRDHALTSGGAMGGHYMPYHTPPHTTTFPFTEEKNLLCPNRSPPPPPAPPGTIKAMLSGPGQFAENETNEVSWGLGCSPPRGQNENDERGVHIPHSHDPSK